MALLRFHDLPVYRLSIEKYNAEFERYVASAQRQRGPTVTPEMVSGSFGGSWLFNEIIGYIRLHILGAQIRGEYYAVSKKRIVRSRSKTLSFRTHKLAPEIDIAQPRGTREVLAAVNAYI